MLTTLLILSSLAVGLMIGWYAKLIKELLQLTVKRIEQQRQQLQERRTDESGVVQGANYHHKGKIVQLPPWPESGQLVRSPSPEQVKREQQRAHEEDLMNL